MDQRKEIHISEQTGTDFGGPQKFEKTEKIRTNGPMIETPQNVDLNRRECVHNLGECGGLCNGQQKVDYHLKEEAGCGGSRCDYSEKKDIGGGSHKVDYHVEEGHKEGLLEKAGRKLGLKD